jgi:hypothetical protein
MITEPGLYRLTDAVYHGDPVAGGSLSSTGLKKLLDSPAEFRQWADHGEDHKEEFDVGHGAHTLVLGTGPKLCRIEFDSYATKAAREARDAAYSRGETPLKREDFDRVHAMAEALRADPDAGPLLTGDPAFAETAAIWGDPETGQMCRAKWDWAIRTRDGRLIIVDYKTTAGRVDVDTLRKVIWDLRYNVSAAHYRRGAMTLGLGDDSTSFVLVFQSKRAPYLVTVGYVSARALLWGEVQARVAIDRYLSCTESGVWPKPAPGIVEFDIPDWADRQMEYLADRGFFDTANDREQAS